MLKSCSLRSCSFILRLIFTMSSGRCFDWQQIPRFAFTFGPDGRSQAFVADYGYCLQVNLKAHRHCECLLSPKHGSQFYFKRHDPATGAWPRAYTANYEDQFFEEHPEFERATPSYGYVRSGHGKHPYWQAR